MVSKTIEELFGDKDRVDVSEIYAADAFDVDKSIYPTQPKTVIPNSNTINPHSKNINMKAHKYLEYPIDSVLKPQHSICNVYIDFYWAISVHNGVYISNNVPLANKNLSLIDECVEVLKKKLPVEVDRVIKIDYAFTKYIH